MPRRSFLAGVLLVLLAAPAWADNPHSNEPAVVSSQRTVEPVIQLVAQATPPQECGTRGSDGILVLTLARHLCLCDGGAASWRDVTTGSACQWDAR